MAIAGESHRPLFRRVLERITSPDAFPRKLSAGEMRQVYQVRVRRVIAAPCDCSPYTVSWKKHVLLGGFGILATGESAALLVEALLHMISGARCSHRLAACKDVCSSISTSSAAASHSKSTASGMREQADRPPCHPAVRSVNSPLLHVSDRTSHLQL